MPITDLDMRRQLELQKVVPESYLWSSREEEPGIGVDGPSDGKTACDVTPDPVARTEHALLSQ